MQGFEAGFGRWIISYRWLVIALALGLVGLAASGGQNLRFTANYRVFFSDDNPQLLAFEAMENRFAKSDNVMFTLVPNEGEVFTTETLAAVEWVTEQAWQTPYSTRVDSLSNFQHTYAGGPDGDELVVEDLYTGAKDLSPEDLARIEKIALNEPLVRRLVVSEQGHVAAVNVTVQLPGVDETKEIPEVVAFARNLKQAINERYPHLTVYLPGMVMMNNAFTESSLNDMQTLVPISFGAMVLFLVLLLKGFSGAAATVAVICLSILAAMGLGGWIGYPLSPPSSAAPTIILTMAIANCVHVLVGLLQEMRRGAGKHDAIVESLRVNLQPVFLASLTTALGFLSMNFSEVPPFNHLGNFVAMGVGAAFVLSVTFLPALVSLLPVRVKPKAASGSELMERFGEFVVQRRTFLLWVMSLVVIVLVASIPRNELNDVFVHYFDDSVQFRVDSDYTAENLNGQFRVEFTMEAGEAEGISSPEFLADVEKFANWLREQPEVEHVNILTDVFKRLHKNMHGDNEQWYRLPESRELAAQYLLLYEMSLPYGLDLNNQIDVEKSALKLVASLPTISSNEILAFEQKTKDWVAAGNVPNVSSAGATGTTLMFSHIGQRNIRSMLVGTTIALVAISLLLILAFRSLKLGLVSLVPNLVPGAMGFGLWGLSVGEVGLSLSVVTGMTLGIVVDDTVHFLSKYLRARREAGCSSPDAVRYAFSTVGRALVITSCVLVAGFAVLATSSFELNAGMGMLPAILIALAQAADILLLPHLLIKLEEKTDAQSALDGAGVPRASA